MYIIFLCNRWCLCTLSLVLLRRDGRLDFYLLDLLQRNWSMRLCFRCILIINLYGGFLLFMRTGPILCCICLYVLLRVSWSRYKAFHQILISFVVLQSRVEAQCDFIIKYMYLTFWSHTNMHVAEYQFLKLFIHGMSIVSTIFTLALFADGTFVVVGGTA
jgi:hypothetical protein